MRVGFEHAAGLGVDVVPLQPFDGLDPADDGEPHLAVLGERGSACRRGVDFSMKGSSSARREHPLDRHVERLRLSRQIVASVGLVSLRSIWLMIDFATPDCSASSDSDRL